MAKLIQHNLCTILVDVLPLMDDSGAMGLDLFQIKIQPNFERAIK